MVNSIVVAWDKLIFCWKITSPGSFLHLVKASKMFHRNRKRTGVNEISDTYHLKVADNKVDFMLRRYAGDLDIFFEVFWKQCYSSSNIKSNSIITVLDLGANIGMATAYFYSRFPSATFYCVEPDPGNLELMRSNLKNLVPQDKIYFLPAAIGPEDSVGTIIPSRYSYNNTVRMDSPGGDVMVLTMSSILSFFNLHHIDLVKMDIEGAESYAFDDTGWLAQVNFIFIEFHTEEGQKKIIAKLEDNGFKWRKPAGNEMLVFAERDIIF